ncbi:arylsulfatase [Pontibacter sp. G13]|uniref:arylsulfatase n=1 Tax=Pontibacter sp. G13 TaxID=3074898 RepID=UPI002889053D|nr:arylsulfatase [Pontibacter sp. G13]WNJ19868.1 arylsulfatase [Pontibacter sp. G13]
MNRTILPLIVLGLLFAANPSFAQKAPPNVILVLTDDQGIGDLSCHGNPWLKTPELDAFYQESVRLTDFHVSPFCTPTRAALMTGQYPIHNGAWATYKGRDALQPSSTTMAEVFQAQGYRTGIFGKWHLGDNYPLRPTDQGFDVAVHHHAGGVGELSDHWGNDYFDDTYYVNNESQPFEGYCTDVWFEQTMKFIEENRDRPFFAYLATNAPHSPLIVAEEYAAPYQSLEGNQIVSANLYGMIANIDENFGRLNRFLAEQGLADNTIFIFMTDNGTNFGYTRDGKLGYNMGFRGVKGDKLEGGHRVPFFIRWPNGKISGGKDIGTLAAHVDVLPTLASLCGFELTDSVAWDGIDLSPALQKGKDLPERNIYVHHRQDWRQPEATNRTCIIRGKWRLINGKKLFDISQDPKQTQNVAAQYPEVVEQLLAGNSDFYELASEQPAFAELPVFIAGNETQPELKLTIQHAIGEDGGIWKPEQVAAGMKNRNNTHALEIERAGEYEISFRRWPKECPGPILGIPAVVPPGEFAYKAIAPQVARMQIANQILEKEIGSEDESVIFRVKLQPGKTLLVTDFVENGEAYGVYYTYVRRVDEDR